MSAIDLSILILGYNQRGKVLNLLHCIETQKLPQEIAYEVIYTDDGSNDDTIDALTKTKFPFPFRYISEGVRTGRGASRNRGAQAANGTWLLFLDADGELNGQFVDEMWKAKTAGTIRQSAIAVHPKADCPARRYEVLRSPAHRFGSQPVQQQSLQSGCFLIERELFFQYGGFDEQLRGRSGEDVDFGARLAKAGIELRSVPTAIFYHNHLRTIPELIEVKRKYAAQGLSRMVVHSPELFRLARLDWLFDPEPPHTSTGFRKLKKWVIFHLPVRILSKIAESNGNFWWCGRTVISLLAFYGTMRGFHDYLISGQIGEEEA